MYVSFVVVPLAYQVTPCEVGNTTVNKKNATKRAGNNLTQSFYLYQDGQIIVGWLK